MCDDLIDVKNCVLVWDCVVVVVLGDIDVEQLGVFLDKVLGGLFEIGSVFLLQFVQLQLKGGVLVIDWDSLQMVVSFVQFGLLMDDLDYFVVFVVDYILGGGGFFLCLMDQIWEKCGLIYGVGMGLVNGVYGQIWQGGMVSVNDKVVEVVGLICSEWDCFVKDGVIDKELIDVKIYLIGEYLLCFDGNGKIVGIFVGMQLIGLFVDYVNMCNFRIEVVMVVDVQCVLQCLLYFDQICFVLVGWFEGVEVSD